MKYVLEPPARTKFTAPEMTPPKVASAAAITVKVAELVEVIVPPLEANEPALAKRFTDWEFPLRSSVPPWLT